MAIKDEGRPDPGILRVREPVVAALIYVISAPAPKGERLGDAWRPPGEEEG
jgi:hypothetical protein